MAVYRNLQEQVFENAKDIEELQQNTDNLELDIVDVQNKTQHLFATSNLMRFNVSDNDKKNGSFFINSNQLHTQIWNPTTRYQTNMNMNSNFFETLVSTPGSEENIFSKLELRPDDLIYSYQESTTDNSKNFLWSVRQQVQTNRDLSNWVNTHHQKTQGKYIIDNYTIDEGTQTINLTLTQL